MHVDLVDDAEAVRLAHVSWVVAGTERKFDVVDFGCVEVDGAVLIRHEEIEGHFTLAGGDVDGAAHRGVGGKILRETFALAERQFEGQRAGKGQVE